MARACVAIVADYAVGDEIFRFGRNVIEPHGLTEGLDLHDAQPRLAFHGLAGDFALAHDGGIDAMKKTQVLAQAAENAQVHDGFRGGSRDRFNSAAKAELAQRAPGPLDDGAIGIADSQAAVVVAAFGVVDAGEEAG